MVLTPSTHILKKLVLIKQIYKQAYEHSKKKNSYISRIQAVIGFDWANEAIIKAGIQALDPSVAIKEGVNAFLQQCENLLSRNQLGNLTHRNEFRHVHRIRNHAQHDARYPTFDEVQDCRTYTRDFLKSIAEQIWAINWDEISLSQAIIHPEIRTYLQRAEGDFLEGNYLRSVTNASIGLSWALSSANYLLIERYPFPPQFQRPFSTTSLDNYELSNLESDLSRFFDEHTQWLKWEKQKLNELITVLAFGLDLEMYKRFTVISPNINFATAGNPWIDRQRDRYSEEEADFVVQFATDSLIKIESIVGDLRAPFGKETSDNLKVIDLDQ